MKISLDEVEIQRNYYAQTASTYEAQHVLQDDEHFVALALLTAMIEHFQCQSVLDVGSGTGRCLRYLKDRFPNLNVIGIEPSPELRKVGHDAGIHRDQLINGNALDIAFPDSSFDIVCEFGVLHHIKQPRVAISEMLRVSHRGIFISDDNHFASGSSVNCIAKRTLARLGLWKLAYWLRTGGKGYGITDDDGLSYAYSVFDDLEFIRNQCKRVLVTNTKGCGPNLYKSAPNVALFGQNY